MWVLRLTDSIAAGTSERLTPSGTFAPEQDAAEGVSMDTEELSDFVALWDGGVEVLGWGWGVEVLGGGEEEVLL